jgi:ubiquitin-conjugating enzyme E2 variant
MDRFYELRIICPDKYPAVPPEVRFITRLNANFADSSGKVNNNKVPAMKSWDRNK